MTILQPNNKEQPTLINAKSPPILDERMRGLLRFIRKDTTLFDIGCDHAKISIFAIFTKRVNFAFACDIVSGPLNNARHNALLHLDDQSKISFVMQNGIPLYILEKTSGKIDILIAGMGGDTIISILDKLDAKKHLSMDINFILSPHTKQRELREYLQSKSLFILDEDIILDGKPGVFPPYINILPNCEKIAPYNGQIYQIITAKFKNEQQNLSFEELTLGRCNIKKGGRGISTLAAQICAVEYIAAFRKRQAGLETENEDFIIEKLINYTREKT